jgi:putative membrane protein
MTFVERIGGMIVGRPYVFVFFAIYLIVALTRLGWRRTALFSVIAYAVAFAAEYSSTRNGFPFGLYHYIETTRAREIWIGNVPFWDSLSFTFLCYLGWRLAVLLYAPLVVARGDVQVAETRAIATSAAVCLSGALLMTLLDVVIDPLTLRGDRWFLGQVYYYPNGGIYFGVPLSNFAGWFLVGLTTIRLYQIVEARERERLDSAGIHALALGGLLDPLLYGGVVLFNLTLTFWIGEPLLGTIGILLYVPMVVLVMSHALIARRRATADDLAAHARDYRCARVPLRCGEEGAADAAAIAAATGTSRR